MRRLSCSRPNISITPTQREGKETDSNDDVGHATEAEIGLFEEEREVAVSCLEEVRRDEDADGVVDAANLARAEVVVDENGDLHPSLPLVGLLAVEEPEVLVGRLECEEAGEEGDEGEDGEGDGVVLLVLLEEERGPVGDEEEREGEAEDGGGDEVLLVGEEGEETGDGIGCRRGG